MLRSVTFSLFATCLLAPASFADHHEEEEGWRPTREACEALRRAQADSMETGENLTEEERRRLRQCERGVEEEIDDPNRN